MQSFFKLLLQETQIDRGLSEGEKERGRKGGMDGEEKRREREKEKERGRRGKGRDTEKRIEER